MNDFVASTPIQVAVILTRVSVRILGREEEEEKEEKSEKRFKKMTGGARISILVEKKNRRKRTRTRKRNPKPNRRIQEMKCSRHWLLNCI